MKQTPTRVFSALAFFVLLWIAVYWIYPGSTRVAPPAAGISEHSATSNDPQNPDPRLRALETRGLTPPSDPSDRSVLPTPDTRGEPVSVEPGPPPRNELRTDPARLEGTRVVRPRFTEYVVQKGDTSWDVIAERVYAERVAGWGQLRSSDYFRRLSLLSGAIAGSNPFVTPDRLVPGRTKLKIPVDPTNIQGRVVREDTRVDDPLVAGTDTETQARAQDQSGAEVSGTGADAPSPDRAEQAQAEARADPEPGLTTPGFIEHTITSRDTLWDIAKAYYGKGHQWRRIYDSNVDVLDSPDRLPVGKVIRIPPAESDD